MNDYERSADVLSGITWITWCTGASVDDVLAVHGVGPNLVTAATLQATDFAAHDFLDEGIPVLLVGALGNGIVLVEPLLPCVGDAQRTRLSQAGVCLSVGWGDFGPPQVTYMEQGHVVVTFDGIAWEYDATPDKETVERWMSTTPGGIEAWQNNYGVASLMAAEAIVGAPIDEHALHRKGRLEHVAALLRAELGSWR